MRVFEAGFAVAERQPGFGVAHAAAGGFQHRLGGGGVPFHGAAEARVEIGGALGDAAEFQRRAHVLGDGDGAAGEIRLHPRMPRGTAGRDQRHALRRRWAATDGVLPAGNLREPLSAVRRATVLAIPSDEPELEAELRTWGWKGPIWRLHRAMEVPAVTGPVAAFCGIARPAQFFDGLEIAGLNIAARVAFRDHHRYTAADLDCMTTAARAAGATALMTTEKDFVRLGKLASAFPEALPLKTAGLTVAIENESAVIDWLVGHLAPIDPAPQ